jgi:hypothetical protein
VVVEFRLQIDAGLVSGRFAACERPAFRNCGLRYQKKVRSIDAALNRRLIALSCLCAFGCSPVSQNLADFKRPRFLASIKMLRAGSQASIGCVNVYSYLSATIGSTRVARRAGM